LLVIFSTIIILNLDFTYSWMGNFCVDKTSKMVRGLEFYEKDRADNLRLQLVLGLQAS